MSNRSAQEIVQLGLVLAGREYQSSKQESCIQWTVRVANHLRPHLLIFIVDVGTPRQTITVIVDTGSWELYLNPNCARAADQAFCTESGHYYPTSSSTARNLSSRYYVSFGTGGFVGSYFSDTLWFGNDCKQSF